MTWLLYMTPPSKQASAARELRRRNIEPYMLMAFPHTRVNRHAKAKRPNPKIRPRYVGNYVALDLTPQQEWLLSREDYMPVQVRPVLVRDGNGHQRRPVLSTAAVQFWTAPPRGLFRDVDVPRLHEATGVKFSDGEKVASYSHGFAGVDAQVIRASVVNGKIKVAFKQEMWELEAEVPVELVVKVA
ncbi:hypothetical protein [Hyphomonas sp. CY54-11-8]|uniref:hypothetical protein n=1 Tax=Hyphomonas sp. CY54-11-8 TaxID=1280944 RepID=UPI000458BB6C|nr:hypothetical protein [Hyphomonas sp. CY54-11-8]KCZ47761.1 hypothetical protein HY17_04600 [Hyphomonas sp. CY54-11-8]